MKRNRFEWNQGVRGILCSKLRKWPVLVVFLGSCLNILTAQNTNQDNLSQQIQKLTEAMASTQAQLEQSQRQLNEIQKQLKALQQQVAQGSSTEVAPESA